jgi:hypothetical protein
VTPLAILQFGETLRSFGNRSGRDELHCVQSD